MARRPDRGRGDVVTAPKHWLAQFLEEAFARPVARAPERFRTRVHARRLVLASAHHRGLALGAPLLRREQQLSKGAGDLIALVRWLAVLADHVDLVGHVLDAPGTSPADAAARRARALGAALALVYGGDEDAQALALGAVPARCDKALEQIARELQKRRYLQGNPIVGLLLNHAFTAVDSLALVHAVVDVYGRVPLKEEASALQTRLAAERLATLAAVALLSEWREGADAADVKTAALWQVRSLGLSRVETAALLEQTTRPAEPSRLATLVPAGAQERVYLHASLAACVDGRVSPEERELLLGLGGALGMSPARRTRVERRVIAFVRRHPETVDPLAHAAGFAAAGAGAGAPAATRVARAVFDNVDALWHEVRETGDLAFLLAKRAAGNRLTREEKKRMREQLFDVVRAVPSLAVFALPGGFVLLPIMLKLLPFDLRPSSFRKSDEGFRAFAAGEDDAVTAEDLERIEADFLRRRSEKR